MLLTRRWAFGLWGALAFVCRGASAADPPPEQREADETFQEGKALMDQGAFEEACSKFKRSVELVRRGGALLNLAVCREKQGRHATAFRLFQDALALALADRRGDREEVARQSIEEVRSKLSWLTVKLATGADLPGLTIRLDDDVLEPARWGTVEPIDRGAHVVSASAPGRGRFETTVTLADGGDRRVVEIPVLPPIQADGPLPPKPAALDRAPPAKPSPAAPSPTASWRKPVGVTSLGLGLAAMAVGGGAGVKAILDGNEAKHLCPDLKCTTDAAWQQGPALARRARTEARVSDFTLPLSVAVAGTGLFFLLSRAGAEPPHRHALGARERVEARRWLLLSPAVGREVAGASLQGAW